MSALPDTHAAVIVPVPAAEPLVAHHRAHLDRAASWGVPAHVTVVFPFVPPADLDDAVVARLAAAVAQVPAFDVTFERCDWFDDDVLWLAPDDAADAAFRALTDAVVEAFPAHRPYDGAYDDVVPHLTVGEARMGSPAALRAAEAEIAPRLPLRTRIAEAVLITGRLEPDGWTLAARMPLSAPRRG